MPASQLLPNTTQVPDWLLDWVMPRITGAEFKVLMFVVRRTYGFEKSEDAISLRQFERGIARKDGTTLCGGTGLSRQSVIHAVAHLSELGLIIARTTPYRPTLYRFNLEASDALLTPLDTTANAQSSQETRLVQKLDQSKNLTIVVQKLDQAVVQKLDPQDPRLQDPLRQDPPGEGPARVSARDAAEGASVPKRNKVAVVLDAIAAFDVEVPTVTGRDGRAIKECRASPEKIAEAYAAVVTGAWGDDWMRENLSLWLVVDRLNGYVVGQTSRTEPRRDARLNPAVSLQNMVRRAQEVKPDDGTGLRRSISPALPALPPQSGPP